MSNVYEGNTDIYGLLNGKPNDNYDMYVCKKPCTGTWEKISKPTQNNGHRAVRMEPRWPGWDSGHVFQPSHYEPIYSDPYPEPNFTGLAVQDKSVNNFVFGVKNDGNQFIARPDRGTNQFDWNLI